MYSNAFTLISIEMFLLGVISELVLDTLKEDIANIDLLFLFSSFCMRYVDYIYLKYVNMKISKGMIERGTSKISLFLWLSIIPVCIFRYFAKNKLTSLKYWQIGIYPPVHYLWKVLNKAIQ